MTHFDIVVAHDLNNAIGHNKQLLCHIPEDMNYFKRLTSSTANRAKQNIVILGRKTYESIPEKFRPLPNRINIVISSKNNNYKNTYHANTPEDALEIASTLQTENKAETIFCIGGSQIYKHLISHPNCRFLYVTLIQKKFKADAFFPNYKSDFIKETSKHIITKKNITIEFIKYKK
jgi:dihydrofolate reductase